MPAKKAPVLIEAELNAALDRFRAYLTRGRAQVGLKRKNLTPATAEGYAERIDCFLRYAKTLNPTAEQAQRYSEWFAYEAQTRTGGLQNPNSVRQVSYALRAWFEHRKQPLPAEGLVTPTQPKADTPDFLSREECRALLERVDHARDYAILTTLLYSGIRASEAAALKVRDLDAERGLLHVPPRGENGRSAGKGEKARLVALHPRCIEVLQQYLALRTEPREPDAPLFPSEEGGDNLHGDNVSDVVRKWSRRNVGRQVSAHILRHSFAVHAADDADGKAPMPLRRLQEQLGHSEVSTTLRYVHAAKGGLIDSYRRSVPTF